MVSRQSLGQPVAGAGSPHLATLLRDGPSRNEACGLALEGPWECLGLEGRLSCPAPGLLRVSAFLLSGLLGPAQPAKGLWVLEELLAMYQVWLPVLLWTKCRMGYGEDGLLFHQQLCLLLRCQSELRVTPKYSLHGLPSAPPHPLLLITPSSLPGALASPGGQCKEECTG